MLVLAVLPPFLVLPCALGVAITMMMVRVFPARNTKDVSPNLVKRRFKAKRPNACWLSDVTYIPTREGWLYLAAVLDVYSRAIVGWGMSHTLGGKLAADALEMAINRRGVPHIVHSDRGSTYATWIYRDLIRKHQIRQSMSRKGDCWDNAPMESLFHSLKTELVMHCDYKTRDEARASLFDYMEVFYNRQRRHSTIKYVAPLVFEASTTAKTDCPPNVGNFNSRHFRDHSLSVFDDVRWRPFSGPQPGPRADAAARL